jgi:hypothetical protein
MDTNIYRIAVLSIVVLFALSMMSVASATDFRTKPTGDEIGTDGWKYDATEDVLIRNDSGNMVDNFYQLSDRREKTKLDRWVKFNGQENITVEGTFGTTTDKLQAGIVMRNFTNDTMIVADARLEADKIKLRRYDSSWKGYTSSVSLERDTSYWMNSYYNSSNSSVEVDLYSTNSDGLPSDKLANVGMDIGLDDSMRVGIGGTGVLEFDETWRDNIPPVISNFDYPRNLKVDEDGTISYDSVDYEGDSITEEIVWGDNLYQSSSITANKSVSGVYEVYGEVSDVDNSRRTDSHYVTVLSSSNEPIAFFDINQTSPAPNESISLDASGSGDLEGITEYQWSLGDGREKTGEQITVNYSNTSTYNIVLEVSDADGNTDSMSKTVTVEEQGLSGVLDDNDEKVLYGVGGLLIIVTLWNFLSGGKRHG